MSPTRRRGSSSRTTRWVTFDPAANTITAGTAESATVVSTGGTLIGATVLRVLGSVTWLGLTVDTAAAYYMGLTVQPETMDALDMDPDAGADAVDWMFWMGEGSRNPAYDGVDSFVEHHRMIDIRGRRKFREGDALLIGENSAGTNVTSFIKLRVLLLNP